MPAMRRKLYLFLLVALLSVPVLPITNYLAKRPPTPTKLNNLDVFFDTDFFTPLLSWPLYLIGISVDPSQAVVGRNGWLFLGDNNALTITEARSRTRASDIAFFGMLNETAEKISERLSGMGVQQTVLLIGPNKSSIYPEMTDHWARPKVTERPTDLLNRSVVDPWPEMMKAKRQASSPLYFHSDTHWNGLGAGLAFRKLAERLHELDPSLQLPAAEMFSEVSSFAIEGGDLSRFLRLQTYIAGRFLVTGYLQRQPSTKSYDFGLGTSIPDGVIPSRWRPLRVTSESAINQRRVLWFRDSFGDILSPLSAQMFSDVLHVYWGQAMKDDGRMAQLVKAFQPEIVIFTIVERSLRDPRCAKPPVDPALSCFRVPRDQ